VLEAPYVVNHGILRARGGRGGDGSNSADGGDGGGDQHDGSSGSCSDSDFGGGGGGTAGRIILRIDGEYDDDLGTDTPTPECVENDLVRPSCPG
jgi:hypothetical protein